MKLNHHLFFMFFLTSVILDGFSLAFGQRLLLNEDKKYPIEKQYLKFLKDSSNQLSIIDVLQRSEDFQQVSVTPVNFGLNRSTYWFKIDLLNLSYFERQEWVLIVRNPFLKTVSVYIENGEQLWSSGHVLESHGLQAQPFDYRFPNVSLALHMAEELTVYVKVQSNVEAYYPIVLLPAHEMANSIQMENIVLGTTVGALFLLTIATIALFLSTRSPVFLYMVLYTILASMAAQMQLGHVQFFLPSHWYPYNHVLFSFIICIAVASSYLFSMTFLQLSSSYPKLTLLFRGNLLVALLGSLSPFYDGHWGMITANVVSFIMIVNLLTACYTICRSESKVRWEAVYYLLTWVPPIIAILTKFFLSAGVRFSEFFVESSMSFAFLLHTYLIMFLLFMRVKKIEQDRIKADKKSLEIAEKQLKLLDTFQIFVPAKILDTAEHSSTSININQSYEEFITLFFADMRGFTKISESMTPGSLMKFLNLYFERFHRVTAKYGGVIDKYIGDAAMVIYSLHNARPAESASAALASAVGLQDKLQRYQAKWGANYPIPQMGIGIHSGQVIMGTVGSKNRKDFTVIGDAVNVAARLESLTKYYGIKLLLTETTYQLLNDKNYIRFIDHIAVYGKTEPTKIYQRLIYQEIDEFEKIQMFYQDAIDDYYQQNFKEALTLLQSMQQLSPNDQVLNVFIQRCQHFLQSPPKKNWDGVFYLNSK